MESFNDSVCVYVGGWVVVGGRTGLNPLCLPLNKDTEGRVLTYKHFQALC